MKQIYVREKSTNADELKLELIEAKIPKPNKNECLIKICASAVNPSDAKGLLGKMPNLTWPRIPGRDFSGIVVEGPTNLIDLEVWGTGGDLGMNKNGSHAEFNTIDIRAIREKPTNISLSEAGSIGVPWTCAWLGMVKGAKVSKGETVVVLGANGKVGEASIQIASAAGATTIGVERQTNEFLGHASNPVEIICLESEVDIKEAIMSRTDGKGADVIMNTVGSPYFEDACNSLAKHGRQIIVTTIAEDNVINLRTFYRGNHQMIGVSNMDYDCIQSGKLLEEMKLGFETGLYKPYPILKKNTYDLENAVEAYRIVLKGLSKDRIIINPLNKEK